MTAKSPFIRIREKNTEIKSLKETISNVATMLSCQPIEVDIFQAVMDLKGTQSTLVEVIQENESIKKTMGEEISNRVEKELFSVKLENIKLKDKVDKLQYIIDNKDNKILEQTEVIKGNKKGFWDFLYKIFNIN